ncbi:MULTISPECIES: hypothetical protein [unclassified Clostridium]|nr:MULTISPECIES: hypothetical protein [unclassified Clostridium]
MGCMGRTSICPCVRRSYPGGSLFGVVHSWIAADLYYLDNHNT